MSNQVDPVLAELCNIRKLLQAQLYLMSRSKGVSPIPVAWPFDLLTPEVSGAANPPACPAAAALPGASSEVLPYRFEVRFEEYFEAGSN